MHIGIKVDKSYRKIRGVSALNVRIKEHTEENEMEVHFSRKRVRRHTVEMAPRDSFE